MGGLIESLECLLDKFPQIHWKVIVDPRLTLPVEDHNLKAGCVGNLS